MIYYINDENEIISSEAFIDCGNEMRDRLRTEYRELTLDEMVKMADEADTWGEYDPEWYERIAELAGNGRLLVNVHLHHAHLAFGGGNNLLQYRAKGLAGAAPRGPEIHQNGAGA